MILPLAASLAKCRQGINRAFHVFCYVFLFTQMLLKVVYGESISRICGFFSQSTATIKTLLYDCNHCNPFLVYTFTIVPYNSCLTGSHKLKQLIEQWYWNNNYWNCVTSLWTLMSVCSFVSWSVCHNFLKGAGSYISMLLSEHLFDIGVQRRGATVLRPSPPFGNFVKDFLNIRPSSSVSSPPFEFLCTPLNVNG